MCESLILENLKEKTVIEQLNHLKELAKIDEFFNTYKRFKNIIEDTEDEKANKNLNKELNRIIEKYRTTLGYGFTSGDTFRDFLVNAQPDLGKTKEKLPVLSPNRIYVIILSFLSGFNAEECNALLASGGYQKLHGRNKKESIFIYCLNNNIEYTDCVLKYMDHYDTYAKNYIYINSFEKLKKLANELNIDDNSNVKYTDDMTSDVECLETDEELKEYFVVNDDVFRKARTTPVRYICKWILEYISANNYNLSYEKTINQIFCDFKNFYQNYTAMPLNNFYDPKYTLYQGIKTLEVKKINDKNNQLSQILTDDKELKRKFFILLYIFFNKENKIEISALDYLLNNCGFDVVDRDNKTIEDVFIIEFIQKYNEKKQDEFAHEYMQTLFVSKIYLQFFDLRIRINKNIPEQMNIMDLYFKKHYGICSVFLVFYSRLKYAQLTDLELVRFYAEFYNYMDLIYRATNREFMLFKNTKIQDATDFENYISETIKMLDEILILINCLPSPDYTKNFQKQANDILDCIDKFIKNHNIDAKRKNNDLTLYIENPLYLRPKVDI